MVNGGFYNFLYKNVKSLGVYNEIVCELGSDLASDTSPEKILPWVYKKILHYNCNINPLREKTISEGNVNSIISKGIYHWPMSFFHYYDNCMIYRWVSKKLPISALFGKDDIHLPMKIKAGDNKGKSLYANSNPSTNWLIKNDSNVDDFEVVNINGESAKTLGVRIIRSFPTSEETNLAINWIDEYIKIIKNSTEITKCVNVLAKKLNKKKMN